MAATVIRLHPLHAVVLAGTLTLAVGAILSDVAYFRSYHVQWSNFAQWLLAGAALLAGIAALCALVGLFRAGDRRARLPYFLIVVATLAATIVDSLVHARDAWATMPAGLVLSIVAATLAALATWLGFSRPRDGGTS